MEQFEKLVDSVINQAEYFLSEFGEFFPFATIVNKEGEIKPLSVYWGEESPFSHFVIEELEKALQKGIENGEYLIVAICVDTLTTPPPENTKVDALEIRIDHSERGCINYYLPYKKLESGRIEFLEGYTTLGTMQLFY